MGRGELHIGKASVQPPSPHPPTPCIASLGIAGRGDNAPDVWMTNHLGPFLFTQCLQPLLESTALAAAGGDVRVVAVSSGAHKAASIHWEDPFAPPGARLDTTKPEGLGGHRAREKPAFAMLSCATAGVFAHLWDRLKACSKAVCPAVCYEPNCLNLRMPTGLVRRMQKRDKGFGGGFL